MLRSLVPSTLLAGAVAAGSILAAPAGASDTPSPSARAVTTLTGFSVSNYPPETYAAALARQSATMGTPEVIRYFYGSSPLRWPPSSGFTDQAGRGLLQPPAGLGQQGLA